jgi:peptidase, M23 family|uniref:Mannosyl-glycoprotein endo-beta-N-acetylglucosaminidase n=1 Tax=Podoviridae sp. ctz6O13 TaxID=2827757 RepID=A0A8S5TJZ8_9CAUD|nr:MAG TPA: Mannosyl-glycoprotein endo-beta-N-acetylglucosaminidase [Podoviridae sp. ctz6O13]
MNISTFYQNAFYSLGGTIIGFAVAASVFYKPVKTEIQMPMRPVEKVIVTDSIKSADKTKLNDSTLRKELIRRGVKHPDIVLAQAKLETGHYTSHVCKRYNNLFGLRHKKGYYKFNTWQESVVAYRDYVQYKYKGGDYYRFLERIGYAEEPNYTNYVRQLV